MVFTVKILSQTYVLNTKKSEDSKNKSWVTCPHKILIFKDYLICHELHHFKFFLTQT